MPWPASAGSTVWFSSWYCSATSACASRLTASNTSAGAPPSGPGSGRPSLICSLRPATRISKNSSRLDETIVIKRRRSSSGTVSSAACASTLRLNARMPSSRLRNWAGTEALRVAGFAAAGAEGSVSSVPAGEIARSGAFPSPSDSMLETAPLVGRILAFYRTRFSITIL